MKYSWVPVFGKFDSDGDDLSYRGEVVEWEGNPTEGLGVAVTNAPFAGGSIQADVEFAEVTERTGADLVIHSEADRRLFVTAGLGTGPGMFAIRQFDGSFWRDLVFAGDRANIKSGRSYALRATLRGSRVTLEVDGVHVLTATLSFNPTQGQVGVICTGRALITVKNFGVATEKARAFVIMQFSSAFDDIHREVIKVVCNEFGLEAVRADESYKPAIIISEITQQIAEAKVIIAEITPANPNVYYEVGFAHALQKPTILLADRAKLSDLPFDLSAWRTLFYENSIGGKVKVEEGLRKHLKAILDLP